MPEISLERLKGMIHYVVGATPPQNLGKVKLNKILWFSDREMFLKHGKTISGDSYLRFPQGPVSKNILAALDELQAEKRIMMHRVYNAGYEQFLFFSLLEPDLSAFSAEEIAIIAAQIAWITPLTAKQVSEISHDRTWATFENGEEISMFAVLASRTRELVSTDLEWVGRE